MGIFVAIFSSIIFIIFFGYRTTQKNENIKTVIEKDLFSTDKSIPKKKIIKESYKINEAETALVKTCQLGQSLVLNCKKCYVYGNTICPYPTDSFCQSVIGLDTSNVDTFWSFLPNATGRFSDIRNGNTIQMSSLQSIGQLSQALRGEFNNIYDYSNSTNYSYVRPSGTATDVCGMSSIVGN